MARFCVLDLLGHKESDGPRGIKAYGRGLRAGPKLNGWAHHTGETNTQISYFQEPIGGLLRGEVGIPERQFCGGNRPITFGKIATF